MAGLLSRERIVAGPASTGGSCRPRRWPSICASAGLRVQRLQAPAHPGRRHHEPVAGRLEAAAARPGSSRIAIVFLGSRPPSSARGSSAPARARRCSPRRCCFGGGFLVSALGVTTPPALAALPRLRRHRRHAAWASATSRPVSTLIKWFPDRPGMATGMAIMGFGGGAMIGSAAGRSADGPLRDADLGRRLARRSSTMGALYFVVHDVRRVPVRVPPPGWRPAGWTPPPGDQSADHAGATCRVDRRIGRTPQFWLLLGRALPERHAPASASSSRRRR